ncbi:hypothetical protein F4553_005890 [Allocatelliglobosispora scoriae]|uniref:Uncharacterized protein n=1 Tax=Allocatelliglobosispora scoriae TaxID=643052 RepID=A0A841BY35_9ACTN|nr:hypothetical protein [Allocatelliglobosispora scoriae]MBB5872456.1 hypothetical protein [Allocatelliglobosispora scoriae]
MGADDEAWRVQRDLAITKHTEAFQAKRAAEADQARRMVADFAAQATERGLRTESLRARAYDGSGTYRTSVRGWYVHPDRSLAVGIDGSYYILGVPASARAQLFGAEIRPHDPKLIIGEGARDGESIALAELLRRRLAGGDDWR